MNLNFGFDIIFIAIIAASTIGCFFLGEEKSQRFMIGTLVGVAASTQLSGVIDKISGGRVPSYGSLNIGLVLLILPVVICIIGKNVRDSKYPRSKIKAMIAGFMSGFVALGYAIGTMSIEVRNNLVTEHNLAALAYDLRFIGLSLLILWLFVTYLSVGKAKK